MNDEETFLYINKEFENKRNEFSVKNYGNKKLELISVSNGELLKIFNDLNTVQIQNNPQKVFFRLFATKQINYSFASIELLKTYYYNPALNLIRTQFETIIFLLEMSKNEKISNKIKELSERTKLINYIQKIIKNRKKKYSSKLKDLYDPLSNSRTHPYHPEGIELDGRFSANYQEDAFDLMLFFILIAHIITLKIFKDDLNKKQKKILVKNIEKMTEVVSLGLLVQELLKDIIVFE